MPVRPIAGVLLAALVLAACENIPYYDQSLDFFSRSRYDPEVKAIEERTPPPQDSPVLSAPPGDAAMAAPIAGDAVLPTASVETEHPPTPFPVVPAWARSEAGAAWRAQDVTPASLPTRPRITPPMGFARSKRVIYGTNRGPFQTGNMRTLR